MHFYEKGKNQTLWRGRSAMKEIKGSGPRKRIEKKNHIFLSLNHRLYQSVSDHGQTLLIILNKSIK